MQAFPAYVMDILQTTLDFEVRTSPEMRNNTS
jgi:hypothetical protein